MHTLDLDADRRVYVSDKHYDDYDRRTTANPDDPDRLLAAHVIASTAWRYTPGPAIDEQAWLKWGIVSYLTGTNNGDTQ